MSSDDHLSADQDKEARRTALDVTRSFIVQAPAGSGKTELLIQRYLALLARVSQPEEILAITFTRKAAAEMRSRIMHALAQGDTPTSLDELERTSTALARAVIAQDALQGWALAAHPARLQVMTIDAFCTKLARQLPLVSGVGRLSSIEEQAEGLYQLAIVRLFARAEQHRDAWLTLLSYLGNDTDKAIALLAQLLSKRDQWLRHVFDRAPRWREKLEAGLAVEIEFAAQSVLALFPENERGDLLKLARFAAHNLAAINQTWLSDWLDLEQLPEASCKNLSAWRGLARWLLTKQGELRRRLDVSCGFPQGETPGEKKLFKGHKEEMRALLERLTAHPDLLAALARCADLPEPHYSEQQWSLIQALISLLPQAAAQLKLLFAEREIIDFPELLAAALQALGSVNEPSDLLLALDYRIRHILVDEFQDTSLAQFTLLERLISGWQQGDGRTLFLVGDPMQSIYRFREAEVGLYLRAREQGIANITLTPLTLRMNFRSSQSIVDWHNRCFAALFPQQDDLSSGAIRFTAAAAGDRNDDPVSNVHVLSLTDAAAEARQVIEIIRSSGSGSIAVLVRNRTHLQTLMPALKAQAIDYEAVEIDPLRDRPIVLDLLSLTHALLQPADRLSAWAVLRAPWCGLSLADLSSVAESPGLSLWSCLEEALPQISEEGRVRAQRLSAAFRHAYNHLDQLTLRERVEQLWRTLGGPSCATNANELMEAERYFTLLEKFSLAADCPEWDEFVAALDKLYAAPNPLHSQSLKIMTIHKAKGLEFDTVIVPGLGRVATKQEEPLLHWRERTLHERTHLLLAPFQAGEKSNSAYAYIKQLLAREEDHESLRLLYVAATRAKKTLHLLGFGNAPGSLLAKLQAALGIERVSAEPSAVSNLRPDPILRRLPLSWPAPNLPVQPKLGRDHAIPQWRDEPDRVTALAIGTVVHRWLWHIAHDGLSKWQCKHISDGKLDKVIAMQLQQLGVTPAALQDASLRVQTALCNILDDPRGRWLLSNEHVEQQSEYALSGRLDGELIHIVIDRTFIAQDGVRWIVDFKTSWCAEQDKEAFLSAELVRYKTQLERYAAILVSSNGNSDGSNNRSNKESVRLGLYFPLLQAWREWPYNAHLRVVTQHFKDL